MNLKRVVRIGFGLLVVALLAVAVADQWKAMRDHIGDLSVLGVSEALVCLLAALMASMMSWRAMIEDLGSKLSIPVASRIFFVGQLAKYVPGSVWSVFASMEIGRDHDVPRAHSGSATLLMYPLNVVVAVSVGAVALPFSSPERVRHYAWALAVLPFCLVVLHPRVLGPVLNRLARLLRRESLAVTPSVRGMARAGGWALATCLLSSLHIYVLARDLGASGPDLLLLSCGAWATAWVVGFLLIIFPGGIGPRDVALVQLMQPALAIGAGTVLVIASRLLFAVAEVAVALGAAVGAKASTGRTRPDGSDAPIAG